MHRQKECFRTILSSFPEGVLIAKVTKLSQVEAQQQAIIFGKKTGGGWKIHRDIWNFDA